MLYATIPIVDNVNANITHLGSYTSNIVSLMLSIAGMAAFVYLAYGGVNWITASGDKAKIEDARAKITNAIIGLALVASSWAIFLILNHFFGLGMVGGDTSGGGNGGGGSNAGGIDTHCVNTSACTKANYCPATGYVVVIGTDTCPTGQVSCACVHETNTKLDAVPDENKQQ